MKLKNLSLRTRIFLAMILLVLLASILIAAVAVYQYNEQSSDYHKGRLERKEQNIKTHLSRFLNGRYHSWELKTENISLIFKDEIYNIADIHKLQISLYDLEGTLLISTIAATNKGLAEKCIDAEILNAITNTAEHKHLDRHEENGKTFQSSYTYITDQKSKAIAILNLPYLENDDFLNNELQEFLERISVAFLFILLTAFAIAFLLSKYITKSLKTISDKINATRLERRNKKIEIDDTR